MLKKLLLLLTSITLLFSCSVDEDIKVPEEQSGKVSFAFSNLSSSEDATKSDKNLVDVVPKAIYITITDIDGGTVINNQRLPLITFGSEYITESLELLVGDYEIITFNVVDVNDVVVYASPLSGSEYGEFVNNPLPISFSVSNNETNNISPEVILVSETSTPEQFGFTSFSFTIVDVIDTTDPTQDLYIQILNQNEESLEEWVNLSMDVNIPSLDYSSTEYLEHDVNLIKIPATDNGVEINITVFAESYDEKLFVLNSEIINNYNDTSPYIVTFSNEVFAPDSIVELINTTEISKDDSDGFSFDYSFDRSFYSIEYLRTTVDERNNIAIATSTGDFENFILIETNPKDDQKYIAYEFKIKGDSIHEVIKVGNTFILVGSQMYRYESSTNATELNFTTIALDPDTNLNYAKFYVNNNSYVNRNSIYALYDDHLYRSDDLGDSFVLVNDSLPFKENYSNNQLAFNVDTILTFENGKFYISTDQGSTFTLNAELEEWTYFNSIAYIDGSLHAFGYFGSYADGTFYNSGSGFSPITLKPDNVHEAGAFIGLTNLNNRVQIIYESGFYQQYDRKGELVLMSDEYSRLDNITEDHDNNLIWSISYYSGSGRINWHYGDIFF